MVSETIIFCFRGGGHLSLAAATLTDFRDGDHKMGRARAHTRARMHT